MRTSITRVDKITKRPDTKDIRANSAMDITKTRIGREKGHIIHKRRKGYKKDTRD